MTDVTLARKSDIVVSKLKIQTNLKQDLVFWKLCELSEFILISL